MGAPSTGPAPAAPPHGVGTPGVPPSLGPGPRQTSGGPDWWLFAAFVVVVVAAIGATAAISYAIGHNSGESSSAPPTTTVTAAVGPQVSQADADAAKQRVCHVFDVATKGMAGQGGLRTNTGELNMPLAIRTVNSVVAIENALTPATPPDVVAAAKKYIDTNLDLTTAAMGKAAAEEGNRLNDVANTATYAFADVCGLPH